MNDASIRAKRKAEAARAKLETGRKVEAARYDRTSELEARVSRLEALVGLDTLPDVSDDTPTHPNED